jgi:hypothetical protein
MLIPRISHALPHVVSEQQNWGPGIGPRSACGLFSLQTWPQTYTEQQQDFVNFEVSKVEVLYCVYVDHLAWPLVIGALLVIAKRGAQPQTPAKVYFF